MGGSSRFCRDCGSALRPGVQFCPACGQAIRPSTQSAKASEASGGGSGPVPTIISPAVTDRKPEYQPWPQLEPAQQPGETTDFAPRDPVVAEPGPAPGTNAGPRNRGRNGPRLLAIGAVVVAAG